MLLASAAALLALSALSGATPVRGDPVTTPTSCVTALASPTPSSFICGLNGKLKSPARIARFVPEGGADVCRTSCLSNKKCVSYSFNAQNGYCQTFSKPLISMGWSVDKNSPKQFFNRNCFFYTPSGCNLPPTSTSTSTSTSSSTPTPTTLASIGYWLAAEGTGSYMDGYYLSIAWADQNYNSLVMGPNSDYATNAGLFDLTNGLLSYNSYPNDNILYPFWQQASSCNTASLAYFYTTPVSSNDVTPTCTSTLTAGGISGTLTCSTSDCGAETWSHPYNEVLIGPSDSPSAWGSISISYAYPQITANYEAFLVQMASSDSTIDGLYMGIDSTGAMTFEKDSANAFQFYMYYGFPQSYDSSNFLTGSFDDPAGKLIWATDPNGPFGGTTDPLVACNPVGSPPMLTCRALPQTQDPSFNAAFYDFNYAMSYCNNDPTYGTGLALSSSIGCSDAKLMVVQAVKPQTAAA